MYVLNVSKSKCLTLTPQSSGQLLGMVYSFSSWKLSPNLQDQCQALSCSYCMDYVERHFFWLSYSFYQRARKKGTYTCCKSIAHHSVLGMIASGEVQMIYFIMSVTPNVLLQLRQSSPMFWDSQRISKFSDATSNLSYSTEHFLNVGTSQHLWGNHTILYYKKWIKQALNAVICLLLDDNVFGWAEIWSTLRQNKHFWKKKAVADEYWWTDFPLFYPKFYKE